MRRTIIALLVCGSPLACDGARPDPPCGDGVAGGDELCDSDDVRGETCASQGFEGGELTCAASCSAFDTSRCRTCGNGVAESGEACDGTDFAGDTCASNGFVGGALSCEPDCSAVDVAGCNFCGDGVVDDDEACDGAALAGATCASRGFTEGSLQCAENCSFDTGECSGARHLECCVANDGVPGCIDDVIASCVCAIDPACCERSWDALCSGLVDSTGCGACTPSCGDGGADLGETCDGSDTRGVSCATLGFDGGTITCITTCDGFDTSACLGDAPVCGDGVAEGFEACDGSDVRDATCLALGFADGQLACHPTCSRFDPSGCSAFPVTSCGDGFLNGIGELCDGEQFLLGGSRCDDFAAGNGNARCDAQCATDLSQCTGSSDLCLALLLYNDGRCDPCERLGGQHDADCDTACTADGLCLDRLVAGVSACGAAGLLDPDCGVCGDGSTSGDEICDGNSAATTCEDFGYHGGLLGPCTGQCVPDFASCDPRGDCCEVTVDVPGCSNAAIEDCVCRSDRFCCDTEWDTRCVDAVVQLGCGECSP